jgi:small conductance mechanosensitive channel
MGAYQRVSIASQNRAVLAGPSKLRYDFDGLNSIPTHSGESCMEAVNNFVNGFLAPLGWKLIGAVAVWIVGGWLISMAAGLLAKALAARKVDATLARYADGGAKIGMRLLLIIAIFGVLGVETTSFAALIAAAGVAIGAAWAGLLANFAAGVFLIILRPFKVGDFVSAGGVTGEVKEIGLFATTIDRPDNVRVFVGNNTIFSGSIENYTANAYRRVELAAQLAHSVNPADAIQRLKARLDKIPNITQPASVAINTFNERGAVLAVHTFCHNNHYWQVYFDTNQAIVEVGAEAGYGVPEQRIAVRNVS